MKQRKNNRERQMSNFANRVRSFFSRGQALEDDFFDDLADLLVEGDFGASEAFKTVEDLRGICKKEKITDPLAAKTALAAILEAGLAVSPVPDDLLSLTGFTVVLLLGVNGAGKTTTAAKLASLAGNVKPILAAADTFRAAAIEQLKIHGQRLGVRVVAHQHGGDPAAVLYDAIEAAGKKGLVIADTAGRMHTKTALVEELKKIDRVVETRAPSARYLKWLVLDATTGRNAIAQAETFNEAVKVDGVILTKCDSSARGGAVYSLAALGLPVVYLCFGEKYEDIKPFDPHTYTKEFLGLA
jgi:fused signal recognition particle receptor